MILLSFATLAVSASGVTIDGGRTVECPTNVLTSVVRTKAVSAESGEFTVSLRFKAESYVKRPGPWEGLVFSDGNGWNHGFRATLTPVPNGHPCNTL